MLNRSKATAATVMSAVAVTALVGGSLAAFTDTDTTAPQTLKAGTVKIDLVEGADWNTNLTNLAVGDTADRAVLVDNTSTLDIGAMRLTAELTDTVGEFGGRLSEAVTVDIIQDATRTLAADVRLSDLADGYDLTFPAGALPAGQDADLNFHYEVVGAPTSQTGDRSSGQRDLPANPDNKYQGSALSVRYTIDAIQRAGTGAPVAAPVATFDAWTTIGAYPSASYGMSAATDLDGRVYSLGGTAYTRGAFRYDDTSATWQRLRDMTTDRRYPASATDQQGRVYAIGGWNNGSIRTVERYDPTANTWTTSAPLLRDRQNAAAVTDDQGYVYVLGGYDTGPATPLASVERYNPTTNTWTSLAAMSTPRQALGAVYLDGYIYAIGGRATSTGITPLASAERYNITTNTWEPVAAMPVGKYAGSVALGGDGNIYALGGYDGSRALNSVYRFSPEMNVWTTAPSLLTARYYAAAGVDGHGRVYAVGGLPATNTVERLGTLG